jgi:hypothetical protein
MRVLAFALLLSLPAFCRAECPAKPAPGDIAVEKAEDCPWAAAAREMAGRPPAEDPAKVLRTYAPGLLKQLDSDRAHKAALTLWGESVNYDELAHGTIVAPPILAFLAGRLGAPAPRGDIMHAGMEHTYGYLFSVLQTKFGFKRARWVRPDVEDGLGLKRGLLGPAPKSGTLLANVTCLAGNIALRDDKTASALLDKAAGYCAAPLRKYSPRGRSRLTEEVTLPGGRAVTLRTDFVPFSRVSGGNSHLLVYSYYDSAAGRAFLVTAFPVNEGFVKGALDPAGLGGDKPVQTRYNAYVEGFTGAGPFKGRRAAQADKD